MKRQTPPARGFTLIELLIVISIIMVLAGLTMSLFSFANVKAASDRARAEVSALSLALESYKIDNGDYPRDDATDALDARKNGNAHISTGASTPYMLASVMLYKALSGDINLDGKINNDDYTNGEKPQIYFEFKSSLLYPKIAAGTTRTQSVTAVVDPFRNVYGYSTIGSKNPAVVDTGYNPTFDLWSTADNEGTKTASDDVTQRTWIKNW